MSSQDWIEYQEILIEQWMHQQWYKRDCIRNLCSIGCNNLSPYSLFLILYPSSLIHFTLFLISYPLSLNPYLLSIISYPLSFIPYPISHISYRISHIPYSISLIRYRLSLIKDWHLWKPWTWVDWNPITITLNVTYRRTWVVSRVASQLKKKIKIDLGK